MPAQGTREQKVEHPNPRRERRLRIVPRPGRLVCPGTCARADFGEQAGSPGSSRTASAAGRAAESLPAAGAELTVRREPESHSGTVDRIRPRVGIILTNAAEPAWLSHAELVRKGQPTLVPCRFAGGCRASTPCPCRSDAVGRFEPPGPDRIDELLVVLLVLVGVALGEVGDRFVERVTAA
jgi:hypothetical protein